MEGWKETTAQWKLVANNGRERGQTSPVTIENPYRVKDDGDINTILVYKSSEWLGRLMIPRGRREKKDERGRS